ncbi:MAG: DUF3592 domain-containing protein [Opitutales bacterium]|nr:DUF3592 domain-containing protein [Opitutales bacterium]
MKEDKWLATSGRILSTNIIEEDSSGSQNSSISYVVNVVWEYKVEGKWFKGASKGWGTGSYSRKKEAMAKLEQYATGLEKDVYYNPEKHYESVFELKSGVLADTSGKLATCMKGLGLGLLVGFVLLMLGAILELQFLIITAILSPIVVYIWYFRSNYQ